MLTWLMDQHKPPDELSCWDNNCVGEVPVFVAVCAFASRIADAAIAKLVEDDRVLMIYDDLKSDIELEVTLLQEVPAGVWDWVAAAVVPDLGLLLL